MEECKRILDRTIDGLIEFFVQMGGDEKVFRNMVVANESLHDVIISWLKTTSLIDKEAAIKSFIQQLPQFQHSYFHLIQNSLVVHEQLWDTVFYNLLTCQTLVK